MNKPSVVPIRPAGNAADIVSSLRLLASDIESGAEPCPPMLLCVADDEDGQRLWVWGEARPRAHLAGVLFGAAMQPVMPA